MKQLLNIFLLVLLISCGDRLDQQHPLNNKSMVKSEDHTRVPLTELYAIFPDSSYFDRISKRYRINKTDYIKFSKLQNVSWNDVKAKINQKDIIPIYGSEGTYQELTRSNEVDFSIQFGGKGCVYMITAQTKNGQVGREQIVSILKTIIYDAENEADELELSNFSYDRAILNYNHIISNKDFYYYGNKKGTLSFEYIENYNEVECKNALDDRISKEVEDGRVISNMTIKDIKVKRNNAYGIISQSEYYNNKGTYCQALLTNKTNGLIIVWNSNSTIDSYEKIFKRLLESIKFKSVDVKDE